MIANFKTEADGTSWEVNVTDMTWKSTKGIETASGKLTLSGLETYSLEPRKPPELCTIGFWSLIRGTTLHVLIKANPGVKISDFTLPDAVDAVRYEVVE